MKAVISFLLITPWLIFTGLFPAFAETEITFWTTEVEKDRLEVQREIARAFTGKTGIGVRLVPVQENLLAGRVIAAYAAKSLPDVLYHPLDFTIGWAEAGVLDARAATEAVALLGKGTFGPGPLNLVRVPGGYAAVPIDGWGQLLLYRKDLFEKKDLPCPISGITSSGRRRPCTILLWSGASRPLPTLGRLTPNRSSSTLPSPTE